MTDPPPADWTAAITGAPARRPAVDGDHIGIGMDAKKPPASPASPAPVDDLAEASWERRAVAAEQRADQLERALQRRPAIEQAKGLLMGVFGLDDDAAFEVLVWTSQHGNIKVHSVAEQLLHAARDSAPGVASTIGELLHGVLRRLARHVEN